MFNNYKIYCILTHSFYDNFTQTLPINKQEAGITKHRLNTCNKIIIIISASTPFISSKFNEKLGTKLNSTLDIHFYIRT